VKIVTLAVVRKFRCSTTHFGEPIALRPCYSISYRRADEVDRLVPDIHGGLVPVDERGVGCELESAIGSTWQVWRPRGRRWSIGIQGLRPGGRLCKLL